MLNISKDKVEIEWMVGTYSSLWNTWKTKGKSIKERVDKKAILQSGFELTRSNRLKAADIKVLKQVYTSCKFV